VQAILAAHIDRLTPADKRLLQAAAVVGNDVPFPLLETIAEEPEEHEGLFRLQAVEFLYDARLFPELEHNFEHAMIHEVGAPAGASLHASRYDLCAIGRVPGGQWRSGSVGEDEIPIERLKLRDDPSILSPPIVAFPLYACATAVTVLSFVPHAELELEIAGTSLPVEPAGFPDPDGFTFTGIAALVAGQVVRARQTFGGATSDWSQPVTVGDHTADYPAGPPRPEINPEPVYECGSRTGVRNLLIGSNVWITADGTEVGRVDGAKEHQGVNVNPDYGLNQHVRAWADLCHDPSPPSVEYVTPPPPNPLPTPALDPAYEDGEQIRITNLVNGARFTIDRGGSLIGPFRTWGHAHLVTLSPPFQTGETIAVTQQMCPSDPASDPGKTTVHPCSDLPAPKVAPIQVGDTVIFLTQWVVGAQIKVFGGMQKIGDGGGPVIALTRAVQEGETIYVYQVVGACVGSTATGVTALCVAPHIGGDPAGLNLFPAP
jgi:hypothetical protein